MNPIDEHHNLERDCAVCLQKCSYPTKLPCGHIFCFLCVKGVAIQSKKCAMCRAVIPADYLDHPVLLENFAPEEPLNTDVEQDYQWYYAGRNGWWKYDEHSNSELESAFNDSERECTLLLAGALYSIDFQTMTQVRCTDHTRRRRVKRDTPLFPAKGIAGIKTQSSMPAQQIKTEDGSLPIILDNVTDDVIVVEENVSQNGDSNVIVIHDDDVNGITDHISMINLTDAES